MYGNCAEGINIAVLQSGKPNPPEAPCEGDYVSSASQAGGGSKFKLDVKNAISFNAPNYGTEFTAPKDGMIFSCKDNTVSANYDYPFSIDGCYIGIHGSNQSSVIGKGQKIIVSGYAVFIPFK